MRYFYTVVLLFSLASAPAAAADSSDGQSYFDSLVSAASSAVVGTIASVVDGSLEYASLNSSEADPFEKYNRWMFAFNAKIDEKALKPVAENYRKYTPVIVRNGVSNFFSNLGDVGVVTNAVLQGKFEQALSDSTRLAINSIAGIGGVIDVATKLEFEKNHEDFGQTFGVWGVPEGPYIVLPVLGPRTLRSAVGTALDTYVQMETLGAISEATAGQELVTEMMSLNLIQQRSKVLEKTELLDQASLDPYVFTREAYLAYRRCQVIDCDRIDYVPAAPESGAEALPDELDLLDELE